MAEAQLAYPKPEDYDMTTIKGAGEYTAAYVAAHKAEEAKWEAEGDDYDPEDLEAFDEVRMGE